MSNVQITAIYEEIFNTKQLKLRKKCKFCKKATHKERCLLNFSYICTVVGNCGRHVEEVFSAVPAGNLDNSLDERIRVDVLNLVRCIRQYVSYRV